MKKISFALLFCLCTLASFAQSSKPLNLKEIVSGEFIPQGISGVSGAELGTASLGFNLQYVFLYFVQLRIAKVKGLPR